VEIVMYVQYGCGFSSAEGWVNFDASPTLYFERIPIIGKLYTKNATRFPANVRYGDIVRGLPITPGTVDGLYASHVLEHLSLVDFRRALKNSFAMLKPGMTFRLIVPDLKSRAKKYLASSAPDAAHDFMNSTSLGHSTRPHGLLARLIATFGNSLHLWMYDEKSLFLELQAAGFVSIRRCSIGDNPDPMFKYVEDIDRFIDGDIVELAVECKKPGT
jgi:hypothetical protein